MCRNDSPGEVLAAFSQAMYEWEVDCDHRSQHVQSGKLDDAVA